MFFNSWMGVLRIIVVGASAYTALVLILRISGKRTLSKMNAFDLVVTVALGSTLASCLLSKDVALVEGVAALGLLIGLQYVVAWTSVRVGAIRRLVKSEPTLLVRDGEFLHGAMRRERVTEHEIFAAIRSQGFGRLGDAGAVVLETDGSFSVIANAPEGRSGALADVRERRIEHANRGSEQ
jgi:uncharacterized membrane protein YcaP (DUF421 family)